MINKQNLWFLTLFSLILVLSVYYITMPSELLKSTNGNYNITSNNGNNIQEESSPTITITESELLQALRIDLDEERSVLKEELESLLTSLEATADEKNEAYEKLKSLNLIAGQEENLEALIKNNYGIETFVKIDNNQINVIGIKGEHDTSLANSIMRLVQQQYENKMFITVKFENS